MVDTFSNLDFPICIARVETSKDLITNTQSWPPFLKMAKEITNDPSYLIKTLAKTSYYVADSDVSIFRES